MYSVDRRQNKKKKETNKRTSTNHNPFVNLILLSMYWCVLCHFFLTIYHLCLDIINSFLFPHSFTSLFSIGYVVFVVFCFLICGLIFNSTLSIVCTHIDCCHSYFVHIGQFGNFYLQLPFVQLKKCVHNHCECVCMQTVHAIVWHIKRRSTKKSFYRVFAYSCCCWFFFCINKYNNIAFTTCIW